MELGFELTQQLQTKLIITPELRQSITILQYPTLDLYRFLRDKADENPLLELVEPEDLHWNGRVERSLSKASWDDEDYNKDGAYVENYVNPIDYYARQDKTLQSYLLEQIGLQSLDPAMKRVVNFLVGNVNEQGYLDAEYEMLPRSLQVSLEDWERAVEILQQLDPPGVGARNLEECLLLQLCQLEGTDEAAETIIRYHLKDIAAKRYQKVATQLKMKAEEVQQIADFIATLQPKPGMLFHSQEARFIIPDVYVQRLHSGELLVQLNDRILPKVHVNKMYKDMLSKGTEAKQYLEEQLQQVQWIERSLAQRQQTILRVAKEIIKAQQEFFVQGKNTLNALTLKQIAQALQVHESTVSRATNQKYIQTQYGVYELKHFFSNRLSSTAEDSTSSYQVKQWIQSIIKKEEKHKPLSDQKIALMLQDTGIEVARRTVAKYREELGILPSSQRKRL